MTVSPYQAAASALKAIIDAEFVEEGFTAIHDNLHEALGLDNTYIGIAPMREVVRGNDAWVLDTFLEVKFYDVWDKQVDPAQIVDPFRVTGYAERLRKAVGRAHATVEGTTEVWSFSMERVEYPNDPTGNKSRFVATIRAYGQNSGLYETLT